MLSSNFSLSLSKDVSREKRRWIPLSKIHVSLVPGHLHRKRLLSSSRLPRSTGFISSVYPGGLWKSGQAAQDHRLGPGTQLFWAQSPSSYVSISLVPNYSLAWHSREKRVRVWGGGQAPPEANFQQSTWRLRAFQGTSVRLPWTHRELLQRAQSQKPYGQDGSPVASQQGSGSRKGPLIYICFLNSGHSSSLYASLWQQKLKVQKKKKSTRLVTVKPGPPIITINAGAPHSQFLWSVDI